MYLFLTIFMGGYESQTGGHVFSYFSEQMKQRFINNLVSFQVKMMSNILLWFLTVYSYCCSIQALMVVYPIQIHAYTSVIYDSNKIYGLFLKSCYILLAKNDNTRFIFCIRKIPVFYKKKRFAFKSTKLKDKLIMSFKFNFSWDKHITTRDFMKAMPG